VHYDYSSHKSEVGKTAIINGFTQEISSLLLAGLTVVAAYANELTSSNVRK
jgi:hypothetical protein